MPNEFGFPGLPVLSDEERLRRNALQAEWEPLRDLGEESVDIPDPAEAASMRALMSAPYGDAPSIDDRLNEARDTLVRTGPMADMLSGRQPASAEALAPRPTTTYRDVAEDTLSAGSFLPGPIGLGSRLATGALGAYDTLTEGPSWENTIQTAAPAFDALGPLSRARNASRLGKVNVGAHGPANAPMQGPSRAPMPYKFNAAPVADEAVAAGQQLPPSMAALADDVPPPSPIDLTEELEGLVEPPLNVPAARAGERFGRNYRSEAGAPGGDAQLQQFIQAVGGPSAPPSISRTTAQAVAGDADRGVTKALRQGGELRQKDMKGLRQTGKLPSSSAEEAERHLREVDKQRQMFGGVGAVDEAGDFIPMDDRSPIHWDEKLQRFVRENMSQAAM